MISFKLMLVFSQFSHRRPPHQIVDGEGEFRVGERVGTCEEGWGLHQEERAQIQVGCLFEGGAFKFSNKILIWPLSFLTIIFYTLYICKVPTFLDDFVPRKKSVFKWNSASKNECNGNFKRFHLSILWIRISGSLNHASLLVQNGASLPSQTGIFRPGPHRRYFQAD